jgi:hypothetical protein
MGLFRVIILIWKPGKAKKKGERLYNGNNKILEDVMFGHKEETMISEGKRGYRSSEGEGESCK